MNGVVANGSIDWWITKDGDEYCLDLYRRHYSRHVYRDGREPTLFTGPGEKLVLRTWDGDAVFVWRKFIDASGQRGINCAIFRNESSGQSSALIRQADAIAFCVWPSERHYTYVDAKKIRSTNPGYCFIRAGWWKCGVTKGGLIILNRHMGTDLYNRFLAECRPEHLELSTKVWSQTPFMIDVLDHDVTQPHAADFRRHVIRNWLNRHYGREANPFRGVPGLWYIGHVTMHGWTWYGFATEEIMKAFMNQFPEFVKGDGK